MKTRTIMIHVILLATMLMLASSVNAKTYNDFAGHSAVQYDQNDMGYPQNEYIESVEYDTDYSVKYAGVRLYLTPSGKDLIESPSGSESLSWVTDFVIGCPEWKSDRSYVSIAREIEFHCQQDSVSPIHIEYLYKDLAIWERPIYGR
jgi:hypothetical protein